MESKLKNFIKDCKFSTDFSKKRPKKVLFSSTLRKAKKRPICQTILFLANSFKKARFGWFGLFKRQMATMVITVLSTCAVKLSKIVSCVPHKFTITPILTFRLNLRKCQNLNCFCQSIHLIFLSHSTLNIWIKSYFCENLVTSLFIFL